MRDDVAMPAAVAAGPPDRGLGGGRRPAPCCPAAGLGGGPVALLGAGAALVFVGVAMLAPVISRPVVRVLGAAFPRLFRTPGRLADAERPAQPAPYGGDGVRADDRPGAGERDQRDELLGEGVGLGTGRQGVRGRLHGHAGLARVEPGGAGQGGTRRAGCRARDAGATRGGSSRGADQHSFIATERPADLVRAAKLSLRSGSADLGRDGLLVDEPTATSEKLQVGSAVTARFADGGTERLRVDGIYAKNRCWAPVSWRLPAYAGAHRAAGRASA